MDPHPDDDGMETEGELRRTAKANPVPQARRQGRLSRLLRIMVRSDPTPTRRPRADPDTRADAAGVAAGYGLYGDFVKEELAAQETRKDSFEKRGLAVITTSGALVTLLFALAALSTKSADTFDLPSGARTWLLCALGLFFISALAALLTNVPVRYQAVTADAIRGRFKERRSAEEAARDIALTRLIALDSAKRKNGLKGKALIVAIALQALATGCVAVAVSQIL